MKGIVFALIICLLSFIIPIKVSARPLQDSLHYVTSFYGPSNKDCLLKTSGVGDINRDGIKDFAVVYAKHTDLYYGADKDIREFKPAYTFKSWLCVPVGDVNNDGYDDIMTCTEDDTSYYDPYVSDLFEIYFGGKQLDTVPKFSYRLPEKFRMLYSAGVKIGDINGDEYDDFVIGSPYNWSDGKGRAFVFLGGETLSTVPALKIIGPMEPTVFLGEQIVGIGDVNMDRYDDFLVSWRMSIPDSDRVYLYYGGDSVNNLQSRILIDPLNIGEGGFGSEIRNAGDLNKDGKDEFIIAGFMKTYVYSETDSIQSIYNPKYGIGGYVGLGTGGDINGDGYNDFLIGNTNHFNSSKIMVGMANGFYGASKIDTLESFSMEGTDKWFRYGEYISIPGDINGDGFAEVFIHEPGWPNYKDTNSHGRAILYSYKKLSRVEISDIGKTPEGFNLMQNYPNPFNPITTLNFQLSSNGIVELKLYNLLGREVMTLFKGRMSAGTHKTELNASSLPGGIYFCRIIIITEKNIFEKSIKMTLLK